MADSAGRAEVSWVTMCMTLPDDGAGALPLLRGIILNDAKTTTYKLGLLRSIARLADLAPALARPGTGDDDVELPIGAVALNWLRIYLPLISARLPQSPGNAGPDSLGFVGDAFRGLMTSGISATDLRIGASFTDERAVLVARAIGDAARTIARMPANFTTYPGSDARVFDARTSRTPRSQSLVLDGETLAMFGSISVPGHVWRAMQRLGAWIEPVLVAEWARLTRIYAAGQGSELPLGVVEAALAWTEPNRDVRLARDIALAALDKGDRLHCVWSGQRLRADILDIDHCLPWSAWPCADLWNLFPAHRRINQHQKRDRLPSSAALTHARPLVLDWWKDAWEHVARRSR
ncbi:HNH endonuclease [Sandarakinorhabdus cyanobacteriorum]|nr:HNH endonuclease domain-containing protein [Sandarakinorhabdus cyanobacteriorum]